jgi:hypothetical protein
MPRPCLRSRAILALLVLLIAPTVAACGGDSKADSPSGTAQVEAYRQATCTARSDYQSLLQAMGRHGSAPLNHVDLASDKKSRLAFADSMVNGADAIVKALTAAGVPDVDGGQAGADAMVAVYRSVEDAFAAARTDFADAGTDDRAAYLAAVKQLQKAVVDGANSLGAAAAKEMSSIDPAFNAILHCP